MVKKNLKWLLLILGVCAVGASGFLQYMGARARGSNETACYSNLKNIGTALEMYSVDWSGRYPTKLETLTPNYLKQLPECMISGTMSYRLVTGPGVGYNLGETADDGSKTKPFLDYYLVWCEGDFHHKAYDTPINFPQYDGIKGLIQR